MTFREEAVLRCISEHDGEWHWYQLDRALSSRFQPGPYVVEIETLILAGFIEEKPRIDSTQRCYFITEAGRAELTSMYS